MSDHTHSQYVEGCYRCDLSRDEVTSGYITEEMVEVAAKTRWDYERAESGDTTEWDMRYPSFREFDTDAMRAALSAVVPGIVQAAKVEALRDAAADIDLEDAAKASDINDLDYDWSGHYWEAVAEGWLHRRTDQIERGGQP